MLLRPRGSRGGLFHAEGMARVKTTLMSRTGPSMQWVPNIHMDSKYPDWNRGWGIAKKASQEFTTHTDTSPPAHVQAQLCPGWGTRIRRATCTPTWSCQTYQEARWLPDVLIPSTKRIAWPDSTARFCVILTKRKKKATYPHSLVVSENRYANKE